MRRGARERAGSGPRERAPMPPAAAQRYAVGLLARRAMTCAAVQAKLGAKGVSADEAGRIVADLQARGLLDDHAYARALVREELVRKAAGRKLLVAKLRRRGVPADIAEGAVGEELETRDARDDALGLAKRRLRTIGPQADRRAVERRLMGLLARRGFEMEVCIEAVRGAMEGGAKGRAQRNVESF